MDHSGLDWAFPVTFKVFWFFTLILKFVAFLNLFFATHILYNTPFQNDSVTFISSDASFVLYIDKDVLYNGLLYVLLATILEFEKKFSISIKIDNFLTDSRASNFFFYFIFEELSNRLYFRTDLFFSEFKRLKKSKK